MDYVSDHETCMMTGPLEDAIFVVKSDVVNDKSKVEGQTENQIFGTGAEEGNLKILFEELDNALKEIAALTETQNSETTESIGTGTGFYQKVCIDGQLDLL